VAAVVAFDGGSQRNRRTVPGQQERLAGPVDNRGGQLARPHFHRVGVLAVRGNTTMPDTKAPPPKLEAGQYPLMDALVQAIVACHKAYDALWDEMEEARAAEPVPPDDVHR
jgi:hypothetical protein